MSNKLTFEEWFHQCGFHKDGYDCNQVSSANSAWHFAQAQEKQEIDELKKKVEELESYISNKSDTIKAYDEYKKSNLSTMIDADETLSQEFDNIFNHYKIFRDSEEKQLKKKVEELAASAYSLAKENESLKKELDEAVDIIDSLCSATEECPERRIAKEFLKLITSNSVNKDEVLFVLNGEVVGKIKGVK